MKLKVFISHSAKKNTARKIRDTLYEAIAADQDFLPIVDKEDLEVGTSWRSTINSWLGGCDAAIVLLCKNAMNSSFVAYEVSILCYRHRDERDNFTLIPVFIDDVDYTAVQSSALAPSFIHELQGIAIDGNRHDFVDSVIKKLKEGPKNEKSLTENRTADVHDILRNVRRVVELQRGYDLLIEWEQEQGIENAKHNLERWFPNHTLPEKLALKMMAAGFNGSSKSIRQIRQFLAEPKAKNLKELMDILSSSWVDHKAREVIRNLPSTSLCLGIQTEHKESVEIYVKCASHLPMQDSWRVVALNMIHGHNFKYQTLKKEVESALMDELCINKPSEIKSTLEDMADFLDFVFVAIPGESIPDEYITKLKNEETFKKVVFVKMRINDSDPKAENSSVDIVWLHPPLDPKIESDFLSMDNKKKLLLKGVE
jgi:hypothetical protein